MWGTPGGDMTGAEPFKQLHAEFLAAFPDLKVEVEDSISDGDNVVVRWRASGTHDGDGLGFEATHQPVSFPGITWFRIEDGKIVEGGTVGNQEARAAATGGLGRAARAGPQARHRNWPPASEPCDKIATVRTAAPSWPASWGSGPNDVQLRKLVTVPAEILLQIIELTGVRPAWLLRGEEPA